MSSGPWGDLLGASALATALLPWGRAWAAARGTELRPALVWGLLAIGFRATALLVAPDFREVAAYLAALTTVAALVSVFNARRPGGVPWAILMGLLVLVFFIPWLEGTGLGRGRGAARVRLEAPWSWFFALLAGAGVTNYLPTRRGPAAALLGAALAIDFAALTGAAATPSGAAVAAGLVAAAAWVAAARSASGSRGRPGMERLWFWFRDRWGVVWALRVQERFNRSARAAGWPCSIGWWGIEGPPAGANSGPPPEAAEATFRGLLRRFAGPERLAAEAGPVTDSGQRAPGHPIGPPDGRNP